MARKTWTLTNVDQDLYVESIALSPKDVGAATDGYTVTKRTLRGGLRQGVDVIEVDNGTCRFVVVPTRGMGIWHAMQGGVHLGWKSPVRGPVHPAFVRLEEDSGLGWLDGFDELLVRCGLESNGAPEFNQDGSLRYGLHGKIANIPAHRVDVTIDGDRGEICIIGVVDEARLFGNKLQMTSSVITRVGQSGLTVQDVVENVSAEPAELELLYHVNFGHPLLEPGSQVVLPVRKLAPRDEVAVENVPQWDRYSEESPGSAEAVFFAELVADAEGNTQALLHNAAADGGVSLKFNRNQLPRFTLWKNRQASVDGYVTGLEPATNFPNVRSFEKEKGRVIELAPGQSHAFKIDLEVHPHSASVAEARQAVESLQQAVTPQILPQPDPEWSNA